MGTWRRWIIAGCVVLVLSPGVWSGLRPRPEFAPVDVAAPASTLAQLGSPVPGTGPAREQAYRACELQGCATVVRTFDLTRPQNLRQVLASADAWGTAHGVVDRGSVVAPGYDDRGDAVGGDWTAYADEQVASVSTVISVSRGDLGD